MLKRLMKRADVTEIINACDAGREGELIFRMIVKLAGVNKPIPPAVAAIHDARSHPDGVRPPAHRRGDDPAGQRRRSAGRKATGSWASTRPAP